MANFPRRVSARTRRRRRRQLRSLAQLALIVAAAVVLVRIDRRTSSSSSTVSARGDVPTSTSAPPGVAHTISGPSSTTPSAGGGAPPAPVAGGTAGLLTSEPIAHYLSGRKGNITAELYDVATGTTSVWRPGVVEDTASIEKVDILATLLQDYQQQGAPPSSTDTGIATRMIEMSDNIAADAIWDEVGQQSGVGLFNDQLGMPGTVLGTKGFWGLTTTTVEDQMKLFEAVVLPGPLLSSASQSYELDLMEHVEPSQDWGDSAGVPPGVTIALKNGWLELGDDNWQVNSLGWVDGDNRDYILAVLTNKDPTEGYGIETIDGLSSLVWTNASG